MRNKEEMVCPICGSPMELYITELGEYVYCTKCSFEYSKSKDRAVEYSNSYTLLALLTLTYISYISLIYTLSAIALNSI